MALAPGSRLGWYGIVAAIGAGGVVEVYKVAIARTTQTSDIVLFEGLKRSSID